MADLVPPDQIEDIVGARRHPIKHLARCDTSAEMVYVLHAAGCIESTPDLRACRYSRALDTGIDDRWRDWEDRPVVVAIDPPTLRLVPVAEVDREGLVVPLPRQLVALAGDLDVRASESDRELNDGVALAYREAARMIRDLVAAHDTCPSCDSADRFRLRAPCSLDRYDAHEWHRSQLGGSGR